MARDELPPDDEARLMRLEQRLPFHFTDRLRALSALTHTSYLHEHRGAGSGVTDNERLEVLGDAVVDLAVGLSLMRRFPQASEGELSHMRAAIVDERGLAEVARGLGLGELLRLGHGERLSGGGRKPSLLSDAMEAVFAAVVLEGGLTAVQPLIEARFAPLFERVAPGDAGGDYKSQLQEWTQAALKVTPRYRLVAAAGPDHAKTFRVEVEVGGHASGSGEGRSKKEAEQAAARQALAALQERGAPQPA